MVSPIHNPLSNGEPNNFERDCRVDVQSSGLAGRRRVMDVKQRNVLASKYLLPLSYCLSVARNVYGTFRDLFRWQAL